MRTLSVLVLALLFSASGSAQDAHETIHLVSERECTPTLSAIQDDSCDIVSRTISIEWSDNDFIVAEGAHSVNLPLELQGSETSPAGGTKQTYYDPARPLIGTRLSVERLPHPASLPDGYEYGYIVTTRVHLDPHFGRAVLYGNAVTSNESGPPQQGAGTYTYDDGSVCTGEWKDGNLHGYGTCTFADGGIHEGQWQDGMRDGPGTTTGSNGMVSIGPWEMDQPDGTFIVTHSNGREVQIEYEQGRQVGETVVLSESPFGGIGIRIDREEGSDHALVVAVNESGPAARADLRVNDILHSLDGVLLDGKSTADVVGLITGPAGTTVSIGVLRLEELILLDVQRATIDPADFTESPPPPSASQLNPDLTPAVGASSLSEGFARLNTPWEVTPGGNIAVEVGECDFGYVGDAPNINITYETSGGTDLRFSVGREGSNAMLLVRTPDGTWQCDFEGGSMGPFDSGARSQLVFSNAHSGEYNIWLGKMYDQGVMLPASLHISEN